MPVGAYLIAWHFSLQHEAIHSFRGVPACTVRFAGRVPDTAQVCGFPIRFIAAATASITATST